MPRCPSGAGTHGHLGHHRANEEAPGSGSDPDIRPANRLVPVIRHVSVKYTRIRIKDKRQKMTIPRPHREIRKRIQRLPREHPLLIFRKDIARKSVDPEYESKPILPLRTKIRPVHRPPQGQIRDIDTRLFQNLALHAGDDILIRMHVTAKTVVFPELVVIRTGIPVHHEDAFAVRMHDIAESSDDGGVIASQEFSFAWKGMHNRRVFRPGCPASDPSGRFPLDEYGFPEEEGGGNRLSRYVTTPEEAALRIATRYPEAGSGLASHGTGVCGFTFRERATTPDSVSGRLAILYEYMGYGFRPVPEPHNLPASWLALLLHGCTFLCNLLASRTLQRKIPFPALRNRLFPVLLPVLVGMFLHLVEIDQPCLEIF